MFCSIAFTAYLWLSLFLVPINAASLGVPDLTLSEIGGPFKGVLSSTVLGYWPFVGTFNDFSPNARGPALVNGSNVALSPSGYVQIRKPGFLSIPAVDIRTINFAITFNLRLPSAPTSREILLSNWQRNNWQYLMTVDAAGTLTFVLRRNMNTNGSNGSQDLVAVTTAEKVPIGTFFNVIYTYNTNRRTLAVYINGILSASAVVPSEITDLTLHNATQTYVQFGNKADDTPVTGQLNADLSQLLFLKLAF
ncbi:hypothetical protein D9619_007102 [Psilocybe cf. subviscida]|uniref:LamG domain-containing protein n=1 Tax=Psilocybe cf. subviscida TaxID=2480587 RepID=A0A8H5B3E2_9AGAR|nr:hypothetical protein D9619_007102 [Psilocybe cf. subviscida]